MNAIVAILMCSVMQCGPNGCATGNCPQQWQQPFANNVSTFRPQFSVPQRPAVQINDPNLVTIRGDLGGGQSSVGNGFVVVKMNGTCLVMSVAHVLRGCTSYTVTFNNESEAMARLVAESSVDDLALFWVNDNRTERTTVRIASEPPTIGTPLRWIGYQMSYPVGRVVRTIRLAVGRVLGYRGRSLVYNANPMPPDGISGSAVITNDGFVVGIVSERSTDEANSPTCTAMAAFLQAYLDSLNKPANEEPAADLPQPSTEDDTPPVLPQPIDDADEPADAEESEPPVVDLKLVAIIEDHEQRITALEGREGEQGPQGEPGPAYVLTPEDRAVIIAELKASLLSVRVDLLDGQGRVAKSLSAPLGTAIALPAVRLQTYKADGTDYEETTAPLGEPLGLRSEVFTLKGE